ncbi:MAG: hypothetical protein ACLTOS_13465, partial [Ruthenibacterium lactatiformans]
ISVRRRVGRVFLTTGSALRQLPRLNLCASARRPRFFNNGKRAAPAAAAESLRVGAPAAFLTMGNPIYGPLRLNFFNNGKPLSQPPRLNLCVSVRRPRFLTMGSLLCPGLQPSQIFSCPFV